MKSPFKISIVFFGIFFTLFHQQEAFNFHDKNWYLDHSKNAALKTKMATTAEDNNIQISPPYFPEHNSLEESYNNKRDLQHLRLYKKNELADLNTYRRYASIFGDEESRRRPYGNSGMVVANNEWWLNEDQPNENEILHKIFYKHPAIQRQDKRGLRLYKKQDAAVRLY